ncbi:hypothetical protein [Sporosarcina ureae]|uniref:hypothetical protein n=1 Tax=Sporosarcina ureae TaxID=1571 RepID=UPI0028AE14A2|nr:hypothetical protein [Sporosarcina ureae]
MKAKKGFYDFEEEKLSDYQLKVLTKFIDLLQHFEYINIPGKSGVPQEIESP